MAKVLVAGSLNVDLVMECDRIPEEGETLLGGVFNRYFGGKGANQAVAAARLGAQVIMVGAVGMDPFGDELVQALEGEGVDTRHVRRVSGNPSGVAVILVDNEGRNRIVVSAGANVCWGREEVRALRAEFAAVDVILVQLEIALDAVEEALALAQVEGTPVILNPAPAQPLSRELIGRATLVTPNEVEAAQLVGRPVTSPADAEEAAREILGWGAQGVVVTLGARGALALERGGEGKAVLVPAHPVQAVDTVGAGDAFNGALATKIAEGAPLVDAVRFANAAAALAVTRRGAQAAMASLSEVEAFLAGRAE